MSIGRGGHRAGGGAYTARWPVMVFVTFLAFFGLTDAGQLQTIDVLEEAAASQSILHGHLWVTGLAATPGGGVVAGTGGHFYAPHGLGMSILQLPVSVLLVAHAIGKQAGGLLYSFQVAVLGAGLLAIFFALTRRLTGSALAALGATAAAGLTTPIWWYSHSGFDAVPTAFFVTLSAYGAWRFREEPSWAWALTAGAAGAAGVLTREDTVLYVAVAVGWAAYLAYRRPEVRRLIYGLAFAGPVVASGVLTLWFNWARFGSISNSGHDHDPQTVADNPVVKGVAALWFSPGKGLVFFAPVVLVAAWGLRRTWRAAPDLAAVIVATLAAYSVFIGRLYNWSGAEAWGPRFLVPILGLLFLPVAFVLRDWAALRLPLRGAAAALALAGLAVTGPGVLTVEAAVNRQHGALEQAAAWQWNSQIYWTWTDFARSIFEHKAPYPSIRHGGIVMDPVPFVDTWWAGEYPGAVRRRAVTDVAVAGLIVVAGGVPVLAGAEHRRRRRRPSWTDEPAEAVEMPTG